VATGGAVSAFAVNRRPGKLSLLTKSLARRRPLLHRPPTRQASMSCSRTTPEETWRVPHQCRRPPGESSAASRTLARSDLLRSVRKRRTVIGSRPPPTTASCTVGLGVRRLDLPLRRNDGTLTKGEAARQNRLGSPMRAISSTQRWPGKGPRHAAFSQRQLQWTCRRTGFKP